MESEKLTEDDLREWIEYRSDYIGRSDRAGRVAFKHIASRVFTFSVSKNETPAQTIRRLNDAANILRELYLCTGREPVWKHRTDLRNEFYYTGYYPMEGQLVRRSVSNLAAALIERPWLESHFVEWVIVDSLVCNEIREFGRSILDESPFKWWELPFVGEKALQGTGIANIGRGAIRAALICSLIGLLVFVGFPILGIVYGYYYNYTWMWFLSIAVLSIYLAWVTYSTVKAIIMKLLGKPPPKTPFQNKLELWDSMYDAYRTLDGPVVDPSRIMKALESASERGAVWDSAVYAVLNRVIARDPGAWVTNDYHSYRGSGEFWEAPSDHLGDFFGNPPA